MIVEQLAGNLIHGLVLGGVYGMATMGLCLIFGVLQVVNVGHGAFIMVGAYITMWMFTALGLIPVIAIPVGLVVGMALGFIFFYTAIRRLIKAPELASLLAVFIAFQVSLSFTADFSNNFLWFFTGMTFAVIRLGAPGGLAVGADAAQSPSS